ncbi:MAG TPA: CU044_2847 family protein [Thermoanaerobaculia bacterium]|nr:CU044_2847 family protein [Thermoanaerobaculia bacterium]
MAQDSIPVDTEEKKRFTILVEWPPETGGSWQVSASSNAMSKFQEKSEEALQTALMTIQEMARRVAETMDEMADSIRPDEAEVEFGVNLNLESGALLAKVSSGAQLSVRLSWSRTPGQITAAIRPA